MSWRGRVLATAAALGVATVLFVANRAQAEPEIVQQSDAELVAHGRELYLTGCSSCHGGDGTGTIRGPGVVGAGAASASFYLTTGRMPATQGTGFQPSRKPPAYPPADIDALVAYVASLGPGPPIPQVDVAGADLARGGVLFRANCAACHQAAGAGGALSYGKSAPPLRAATAQQVVEAMRVGPGEMPVFNDRTISDQNANDVTAYVQFLRDPGNRGGLRLGGTGPVPEGLVSLVAGLGGVVALSVWIVRVHRRRST